VSEALPIPSIDADVVVLMVDPMIEIDGDVARIADDGLGLELRAVDRLIS
jgi:hypothetical protein